MTPPKTKRTATSDESEEVCKKIKEEIKSEEQKEQQSTNNNNDLGGDNKSINNGTDKVTTDVKADEKKTDESNGDNNGTKEEDKKTETTTVAAAPATETKVESEQTNGNKNDVASTEETQAESKESTESEDDNCGTLLICGGANWDMTGRKELPKTAKKPAAVDPAARNLWGPNRVRLEKGGKDLRVRGVFSGCNACHSVIVVDDGSVMTFGRNDKGQLGLGDTSTRTIPVVIDGFKDIDIVAAACGRSHTLFLDSDGIVYACGDNKMGQCGTNQMAVQQITTPTRIAFKENKPIIKIACGAEFSMIVDEDGRLYSFGHPEHGQLGHNSEAKYFTSGNKYAFHCEYQPRRIVTFIEKSREGHVTPVDDVQITDVACGTNHTLAVDRKNRCYSWGFAGYHRLGHSDTKNEMVPRSIRVFDAPPNSGRGAAKVFAGSSHSMALDMNGLLYFWGQNKSSGEATMYPKNVQDLCGWNVNTVSCANRSIFVVADHLCISWGPSPTYGELGYGEGKSKSSTTPQEVKTLDSCYMMDVACGFGHTLLIARDSKKEDATALSKLECWP